ncbi:hypothetical protein AMECASPLE_002513, partial [Ameca splendens]
MGHTHALYNHPTCRFLSYMLSLYPSQSVVPSHCHYSCSQLYCHVHSLAVSVFLPVSLHLNFSVFLPIITSHLRGPLLRRASHLSPRCDNRYRWRSLLGLSPINTCSALSLLLSFHFSIF